MGSRRGSFSAVYDFLHSFVKPKQKDPEKPSGITVPVPRYSEGPSGMEERDMAANGGNSGLNYRGSNGFHPSVMNGRNDGESAFDFRSKRNMQTPRLLIEDPSRNRGNGDLIVPERDTLDALPTPPIPKNVGPVPRTSAPKNLFSNRYHMHHGKRGIAVIINNRYFNPHLTMPERKGTDEDAKALFMAMKTLEFEVHQYDNLKIHDMKEAMKYFASLDHSDVDCFLTAVLSHGDDGVIYGIDGKMTFESLTLPFKGNKCLSLVGKPKIFIFQACRGDRLDRGVDLVVADDKESNVYRLPSEADFLFAFSTIPGFYSWRNTDNGSWYIQALARMIEIHYGENVKGDPRREVDLDFVKLLTRVNFEVAYFYKSNVPANVELDQQKQIPSIVSMLTRDLYFPVKAPGVADDQMVESLVENVS